MVPRNEHGNHLNQTGMILGFIFLFFFGGFEPDVCNLGLFEDPRLSEISPWVVGFLAATSSVLVLEQEIANLNQFWKKSL